MADVPVRFTGDAASGVAAARSMEQAVGRVGTAGTAATATLSKSLAGWSSSVNSSMANMEATMLRWAKRGSLVLGGAFIGATKFALDFERQMRNVNSIAKESESAFERISGQVLRMARESGQAPKVLASGLYDIVSSGFKASQAVIVLRASAKAATAGLTDTATSAKAISAALNAYHLSAKQATKVSDILFTTVQLGVLTFGELSQNMGDLVPAAAPLGIRLEEVGAAMSTLTLQGVPAAEAATRVKNVMLQLARPSENLAKLLKANGYESGEAAIKARGFVGVLQMISDQTKGSVSGTAALTPEIRALMGAVGLTGKNLGTYNEHLKVHNEASKGAGATALAFAEQSKSLGVIIDKGKASLTAFLITMASGMLPVLGPLVERFGAWAGKMMESGDAAEWVNKQIASISDTFAKWGPRIATVATTLYGFADGMQQKVGGWGPLLQSLVAGWIAVRVAALTTMAVIRIQAMITAGTIKAAMITTGIGAVIVALALAVPLIIANWEKIRVVFERVGTAIREHWQDSMFQLKEMALKTYLAILEPFSHLSTKLGGRLAELGKWARKAKEDANAQLAQIRVDRNWTLGGRAHGDAYGKAFQAAANARIAAVLATTDPSQIAGGGTPSAAAGDRPTGAGGLSRGTLRGATLRGVKPLVVDMAQIISAGVGEDLNILSGRVGRESSTVAGSGRPSAHRTGDAADIGPYYGKKLIAVGQAALIAAGMPEAEARKHNSFFGHVNGWNIIYNCKNCGGDHTNHVHIGASDPAKIKAFRQSRDSAATETVAVPGQSTTTIDLGGTTATANAKKKKGLVTTGLDTEQTRNAKLIYDQALKAGLTPKQALELVAVAYNESGLRTNAKNKKSGAMGLFQLLSQGYLDRYAALRASGLGEAAANIQAILPDYVKYFKANPNALAGAAGSAVERSGKGADFYARGLGSKFKLGAGGFTGFGGPGGATPGVDSAVSRLTDVRTISSAATALFNKVKTVFDEDGTAAISAAFTALQKAIRAALRDKYISPAELKIVKDRNAALKDEIEKGVKAATDAFDRAWGNLNKLVTRMLDKFSPEGTLGRMRGRVGEDKATGIIAQILGDPSATDEERQIGAAGKRVTDSFAAYTTAWRTGNRELIDAAAREVALAEDAFATVSSGAQGERAQKLAGSYKDLIGFVTTREAEVWDTLDAQQREKVDALIDNLADRLRTGKVTWAQARAELGAELGKLGIDIEDVSGLFGDTFQKALIDALAGIERAVDRLLRALVATGKAGKAILDEIDPGSAGGEPPAPRSGRTHLPPEDVDWLPPATPSVPVVTPSQIGVIQPAQSDLAAQMYGAVTIGSVTVVVHGALEPGHEREVAERLADELRDALIRRAVWLPPGGVLS